MQHVYLSCLHQALYWLLVPGFMKNRIVFSNEIIPRMVPIGWHQQALRNFAFRFADALVFQTEDARSYFPKSIQKRGVIIS